MTLLKGFELCLGQGVFRPIVVVSGFEVIESVEGCGAGAGVWGQLSPYRIWKVALSLVPDGGRRLGVGQVDQEHPGALRVRWAV